MIKREPGIDLFRCLGLLFVNGLHACLYNGFYYESQEGAAMWLANSFRWLFFGCNAMFMLLTGYLKSTKPFTKSYYKGLVPILIGYVLTCVISYPIRYFLIGEKDDLFTWLERFVTFSNYSWYIEMYIGLILISPIINLALAQLTENRQLYGIAGIMVFVTTLSSITPLNLIPDYWSSLYPLTLYVLGAVIRRTKPNIPSWAGLLGAALTAMGLGLASLLTAAEDFYDGFAQGGYGGFWVTVMVTFLFLGVYRLPVGPKAGRVLAWMAGGVFEGYILSRLFDVWIYGTVKQWHDPQYYGLIFLCVTIPVFLISLTAGKAVHTLSNRISKAITK